jgi:hypothetical protein
MVLKDNSDDFPKEFLGKANQLQALSKYVDLGNVEV